MRQIKTGAIAVALLGVLAACSDDPASTNPVADEGKQATSAAPTPGCPAVAFHHDDLAPGCWAIQVRGLAGSPVAELDLPAGFSGNDAWVWVNADQEGEWGAITLMPVGDVYRDPCTRAMDPRKVGPSVEDFATALAAQKVTTTTTPRPVSVDGHDGVYLELSAPGDVDVSRCRGKGLLLWEVEGQTEAEAGIDVGQVNRYWVLDVEGQRLVLLVATTDDAPDETVERFTAIAESATFAEG